MRLMPVLFFGKGNVQIGAVAFYRQRLAFGGPVIRHMALDGVITSTARCNIASSLLGCTPGWSTKLPPFDPMTESSRHVAAID